MTTFASLKVSSTDRGQVAIVIDAYGKASSKGAETLEKPEEGTASPQLHMEGDTRELTISAAVRQRGRKKLAFG